MHRRPHPDPSERQACIAKADKTYREESHPLFGQTWREVLVTWVFFTVIGLFLSFVVALIVRTMGYVALGFSKPAQP